MPGEQDRHHQQRGGDRPQDERARRVHRAGVTSAARRRLAGTGAAAAAFASRPRAVPAPGALAGARALPPRCPSPRAARPAPRASRRRGARLPSRDELDLRAFAQLVGAVDDDLRRPAHAARRRPSISPCAGPSFTGVTVTVLVVLDDVDEGARRAALDGRASGTSVASCSVSTSMRTLTNWFGKSAPSSLANSAFSLTVPVVGSIWLSTVTSLPVASFVLAVAVPGFDRRWRCRRDAAAASRAAALSSGIGKTTLIGCSCAMTTMPLASDACTMLPGSTWRRPTRPLIGARDARVRELQLRVVDRALVGLERAFVLAHQRLLRVDLLLARSSPARAASGSARGRPARWRAAPGPCASWPLRLRELHLERPRIDLGEQRRRP